MPASPQGSGEAQAPSAAVAEDGREHTPPDAGLEAREGRRQGTRGNQDAGCGGGQAQARSQMSRAHEP